MSVSNNSENDTPVSKKRRMDPVVFETGVTCTTKRAVWKIKNFAQFRNVTSLIHDQNFELDVTDNNGVTSQFRVSLIRTMQDDEIYNYQDGYPPFEDNIGLHVKLLSDNEVAFKLYADIKSATGKKFCGVQNTNITSTFKNHEMPLLYTGFLNNRMQVAELPLEDGALVIHLKFEVFTGLPEGGLAASAKLKNQRLSKLEKIMSTLEMDTESADVTIISKDGERFPAHKFILTSTSPVFETMLNVDMIEKKTSEIKLDLSGKCVKILRHFIYTGKLADGWKEAEVVLELANAAQMYFLSDLVEFIDKVLGGVCTAENAPALMVLANKLGMKRAQKQILSVVKMTTGNVDDFMAVVETLSKQ